MTSCSSERAALLSSSANADALERARERSATTSALLELASTLAELVTPVEVAQKTAEAMTPVVGADAAVVYLLESGRRLLPRGMHGWSAATEELMRSLTVEREIDEVMSSAFHSSAPTILRSSVQSPTVRSLMAALAVEAVVAVPIRRRDSVLGFACAAFERGRAPSDLERRVEVPGRGRLRRGRARQRAVAGAHPPPRAL